jgi:nitroimidazol reductase NimA-like FMN-containing flavoprotein (pyridoxamine 5'-phosphate oxidase superfamily)
MSEVTEKGRLTSNFAELSRSECEKLLAEHSVGRVGLAAPTGPQILPVTYAYYGKTPQRGRLPRARGTASSSCRHCWCR